MRRSSFIGFFTLSLVYFVTTCKLKQEADREVEYCESEECHEAADYLLSNMNSKIDPCDDFYEYACGNYERNGSIFKTLESHLMEVIHNSLSEEIQLEEIEPIKIAKRLFRSCMNEDTQKKSGLENMREKIELLGGWPVIQPEWDDNSFNWMNAVFRNRDLGFPTALFFKFSIYANPKNISDFFSDLSAPTLSLPRQYLVQGLKNKNVRAYFDFMIEVAVILGADENEAEKELAEVVDFEIKLAKLTSSRESSRNFSTLYHPMTINELSNKYTSIRWNDYFHGILFNIIKLDSNYETNVIQPQYVSGMDTLLKETSSRVLANYVVWRSIRPYILDTFDKDLRKSLLKYAKKVFGQTDYPPRWKECTTMVSQALSIPVAALYIRKLFDEESKDKAEKLVSQLQFQFRSSIEKLDWMDEVTREAALRKIDAMESFVAYPSELSDDSKISDLFGQLELNSDDHVLNNILRINIISRKREITKVFSDSVVVDDKWEEISRVMVLVNALYHRTYNAIVVPAAILQGFVFSKNKPNYMNFASIGWIVGHEITHGFDDSGSQLNEKGQVVNWWQPETATAYKKKSECIIKQYSNYTVLGLNLDGINSLGENISDNGGLGTAYQAYKNYVQGFKKSDLRLPGLKFNPEQMFWISAASFWCTKEDPEWVRNLIITDAHSPNQFRVIGAFSNNEDFSKDFNCPLGSRMNPTNKCKVW